VQYNIVVFVKNYAVFGVSKMGRHRSRLKILEEILSAINNDKEIKKTHIMYKAYLSYSLLKRYLNDLLNASLIVCDKGNCYSLTNKGETFLARFNEYSRYRERLGEQLIRIENEMAVLKEIVPKNGVSKTKRRPLKAE
jgi:predicted transcriptional regulator